MRQQQYLALWVGAERGHTERSDHGLAAVAVRTRLPSRLGLGVADPLHQVAPPLPFALAVQDLLHTVRLRLLLLLPLLASARSRGPRRFGPRRLRARARPTGGSAHGQKPLGGGFSLAYLLPEEGVPLAPRAGVRPVATGTGLAGGCPSLCRRCIHLCSGSRPGRPVRLMCCACCLLLMLARNRRGCCLLQRLVEGRRFRARKPAFRLGAAASPSAAALLAPACP